MKYLSLIACLSIILIVLSSNTITNPAKSENSTCEEIELNVLPNLPSLNEGVSIYKLLKGNWYWRSLPTAGGYSTSRLYRFKLTEDGSLDIVQMDWSNKSVSNEEKSTINTYATVICGPILKYHETETTIALSGRKLIFNAVVPVGKNEWYTRYNGTEMYYKFQQNPLKKKSGTVTILRYPGLWEKGNETLIAGYKTTKDEYGSTIKFTDKTYPDKQIVHNIADLYFSKEYETEQIGSQQMPNLKAKAYILDELENE